MKITKNPADDVSFEQLGHMMERFIYLGNGIDFRRKKQEKLLKEIKKERKRLKKIGYKMDDLDIKIIKGMKE